MVNVALKDAQIS